MPDPIQPITPPTPQEPAAPVLPNPQDMVDAALSGDTTSVKTATTESVQADTSSESKAESSLPPLAPLSPTSEPVSAAPVTTPTPSPAPESTVVPPVVAPAAVAMGDDTPLAFAGMSTPPTTSPDVNPTATQPLTPPPTEGAPLPPIAPQAPVPKKKGKLGIVVGGLLTLLVFVFGGVAGYQYLTIGESPAINFVVSIGGGKVIDTGSSNKITNDTVKKQTKNSDPVAPPAATPKKSPIPSALNNNTGSGGVLDNYQYNTGNYGGTGSVGVNVEDDKKVAEEGAKKVADDAAEKAKAKAKKEGKSDAEADAAAAAAKTAAYNTSINTSNIQIAAGVAYNQELNKLPPIQKTICNDTVTWPKPTYCDKAHEAAAKAYANASVGGDACDPNDKGGTGCPISCTAAQLANYTVWKEVVEPGGGSYCKAGVQCNRYRIERYNGTSWCFVKYGEQCGGECGGGGTTTLTTTPTIKCDGLTSVPAVSPAPTVGTKLTFTCAGTVTPTSAGTPSYKFRYSINGATPLTMTPLTAAPNKAELTINACGTYKVECQACATLNGVLTCSPVWTGATQ